MRTVAPVRAFQVMNDKIVELTERLGRVIDALDIARDCFHSFLHSRTTPQQFKSFSEHGHETVQESRKELQAIRDELAALPGTGGDTRNAA